MYIKPPINEPCYVERDGVILAVVVFLTLDTYSSYVLAKPVAPKDAIAAIPTL